MTTPTTERATMLTPAEVEKCRQAGFAHGGLRAAFDFEKAAEAVQRALLARLGEQLDRLGVHPLSVNGVPRTERQSGWNDCMVEVLQLLEGGHPSRAPVGAQERKAAEHAYITTAFDYASAPVGSRDWTLFWAGWQAARSAAQGAVQVPAWVSVHDALPTASEDDDVPVWTWDGIAVNEDNYGPIFEQPAGPAVGGWVNVGHGFAGDTMGSVTHWMPRPTPAAPAHAGERSEGGA